MKNRVDVAVHIRVYRHAYTRVAIGLMYYAMTLPGREDDNAECLEARVSVGGLCARRRCSPPGGLHVLGTRLHRLVPRPRDPFKCPTARRPDPQELLELLFYRGDSPENRPRIRYVSLDPPPSNDLSLTVPDSVKSVISNISVI